MLALYLFALKKNHFILSEFYMILFKTIRNSDIIQVLTFLIIFYEIHFFHEYYESYNACVIALKFFVYFYHFWKGILFFLNKLNLPIFLNFKAI